MAQFQEADLAALDAGAADAAPSAPEAPAPAAASPIPSPTPRHSRRRHEAPEPLPAGPWWTRKSVWGVATAAVAGLSLCLYLCAKPGPSLDDLADDAYPDVQTDLGAPGDPAAFAPATQQVAAWEPEGNVEHAYAQASEEAAGPALGPSFPGAAEHAVHYASEEQPGRIEPVQYGAPARAQSPAWLPGTIEIDFADSPAQGSR